MLNSESSFNKRVADELSSLLEHLIGGTVELLEQDCSFMEFSIEWENFDDGSFSESSFFH
jgi:hypothetical protein